MAQCYAESSKPIGGTFDMHGGGYTGRLYCSGFPSYPSPAPRSAATTPDLLVPMLRFSQQQQQQQSSARVPISDRKSEAAKLQTNPKMPALESTKAISPPEIAAKPGSKDTDRAQGSLAIATVPEKSSGELAMAKKAENLPQKPSSGEIFRSESDSGEKPGSGKCKFPLSSAGASPGMLRSGSGEIEVPEALASQAAKNVGSAPKGTKVSPASSSCHQSWPSSPANFRPAPRTRNLSEGSFSMIFPEDSSHHHHQNHHHQSSRLYSTSPSRSRGSREAPVKPADHSSSKEKKQEKPSTKNNSSSSSSPQVVVSGPKSRSHAGSPPRSASKDSGQPFIRHSRNVSDGNWGALNSLRGNSSRLNPPVTSPKLPEKSVVKPPGKSPLNAEGFNGGFVTGGSFSRSTTTVQPEKVFNGVEKLPELVTPSSSFGNITRGSSAEPQKSYGTGNVYLMGESMLLKKALGSRDAEEVKLTGNEQYKRGHFQEALALYDRAISLSPGNAAYHSNRAAALAALGRLVEAVQECEEALSLDPGYSRAHQRLGSLCVRLGWIDDARRHLQAVGDAGEIQRAEVIAVHLTKCHEARRVKDWQAVIRESDAAVVAGAESSIQAYALKAEALLNLRNVNEAERVIQCAKRLGAKFVKQKNVVDERLLCLVEAEVDLAQGRFDEALLAAEKACQNEPSSGEVCGLERMIRRVVRARSRGNELFKAAKYFEASAAYGEGLELFPDNAVLLCNRAACRSKLRLWEKAIEDCNAALSALPSYTKALLRRAQCHSQLERWESAMRDYEVLKSKLPGDVEVARALFEVQVAFKKEKGEKVYKFRFGGEIEEVFSPDQFKQAVASPGLAVVHFISRWSERCKQMTPFIDGLCKRYPSVNFVKVDIEDHPFLAKTECVATVPTFKVYKNGLKVTEMLGPSQQKLEDAVQHYIF